MKLFVVTAILLSTLTGCVRTATVDEGSIPMGPEVRYLVISDTSGKVVESVPTSGYFVAGYLPKESDRSMAGSPIFIPSSGVFGSGEVCDDSEAASFMRLKTGEIERSAAAGEKDVPYLRGCVGSDGIFRPARSVVPVRTEEK